MSRALLFVGIGGFVGSIARILCQQYAQRFLPFDFPTGTIAINVIGSFAIGLIYGLADQRSFFTPEVKLFLTAGLCGGFTTFSSFTYEAFNLIRNGQISIALLYITASNGIGLVAVAAGYYAGK